MAETSKLTDDLAALAESERLQLGAPPTAEQLLAYRDGKLPDAEAERIRDRLAIDPQWASIYLDLLRSSDPASTDEESRKSEVADAEVDAAWRAISAKLDQDAAESLHAQDAATAVPRGRRSWGPLLLPAMVVLGLGLGWFLIEQIGPEEIPAANYHVVLVSADPLRDPRLKIPGKADGIEFRIAGDALDNLPAMVFVEITNASGKPVWGAKMAIEAETKLIFRVDLDLLELGRTYELIVWPAEPSPDRSRPFRRSFQPVLEPTDRSSSTVGPFPPSREPCRRLGVELDHANEIYEQGDVEEAAVRYQKLLDTSLAEGCPLQEARAHNGLGFLANRESRLVGSLGHLQRGMAAVATAKELGLPATDVLGIEASLEHNRGMAFFRLGRLEDARDAFIRLRALRSREGASKVKLARAMLLSARIHRLLGDTTTAATAIGEGLELLGSDGPKVRASLWQEQAQLHLAAGRLQRADEALKKALEALEGLREPIAKANVLGDVAELEMRRGKWEQCLQRADESLTLAAAGSPDLNLEAHARYLRSVALAGLGDFEGAMHAAESGLATLEATRGLWRDLPLQFFAQRHAYARHRLDLAAAIGDPEDAWSAFETSRARGLLESLSMQPRSATAADESDGNEELQRLGRLLIDAIRQLDAWDPDTGREARELLAARVRARRRNRDEFLAGELRSAGRSLPRILEPEEAREILDGDTLGLAFASGAEKFHVLILDPDRGVDLLTLSADRRQIAKLGDELLSSLGPEAAEEIQARVEPTIRQLSRHLLGPLEGRLAGVRRLVIVADQPVEGLPFDLLRNPRSGRRMIADHQIILLPSFSALGSLRRRAGVCPPAEAGLLAMADPVFSSRDRRWPRTATDPRSREEALALVRLPASAEEARNIAGFYPEPTVLVGRYATRERLLTEARKHRVIHLASHARSDAMMPDLSKISLSCVDSDDRAAEDCDLYFPDIVNNLDLCGQIVVLSACTTAGGKSVAGEGILGLPNAFLRAGASAVVASHWQVPDETTARMMSAFHRHLREHGDPAAALRKAKLEMLAADEPPSIWAAFALLGDWRIEAPSSTFPATSGPMEREVR